jgi:2,4-dienoyl-CoA reductase-like NADH-dependent reductase (Old Yellow Enzyme family)
MSGTTAGLKHALTPISINGLEIKNRVVRTAHGTHIGQGRVSDDLIAYHAARARGGVGLTVVEAASVHPTDEGTLRLHDDSCIADFRKLMAAVEGTGMRVFAQLNHLGHDGKVMPPYTQPWSASAVRSPGYGWLAHEMTLDEIEELIACFARVARWAREGGLHGIEVHAAHGYLLQQFMSPVTNHRTDRYGGSFENRLRLTTDVLHAVRKEVGYDFVVGLRTGADATEDGLQADDCADVVRAVVDAGLIDYVNVTYGSARRSHKIIGAMHEPMGYELPTSEVVSKATYLPTIVTGRFRTLAEIDKVIDDGMADMVAMTRAHIADPDIVVKTMQGRADEVRPCLACNQGCLGGFGLGRMACTMNADVGFERDRVGAYDRVALPRKVLVVGGGPSGLEAARVAALRGHRVTLCEADTEVGGNIRWSRLFHERATIGDSIDWLEADCQRRGVDIRVGTRVDDELIQAIKPDVIVIATGGAQPSDRGNYTSIDIARASTCPPGVRTAVIIDRFGAYEVLGVAEKLVRWGVDVEILTPHKMLAPRILYEGVIVPTVERLKQGPGRLSIRTEWDPASGRPDADAVIVIDRDAAPLGLSAGTIAGRELHHVGDAAQPGNLWAAIRTGNAVGREI